MSSEPHRVVIGDEPIEYTVRRSPDATEPRIDVGIHEIAVVIPTGESINPRSLLEENAEWVLDKKAKFDRYLDQVPDREFREGETFPYLGTQHEVVIEQRSASDIEEGAIRLAAHNVEQTSVQQALERLFRRKARDQAEREIERYAEAMAVDPDELEIRNQRTKWGSCSSSGTLGINWRLVMAPPEIFRYVVIHELAHLQEANHTDEFWQLVAEHDSDYRDHAAWLEEHSAELVFSKEDV